MDDDAEPYLPTYLPTHLVVVVVVVVVVVDGAAVVALAPATTRRRDAAIGMKRQWRAGRQRRVAPTLDDMGLRCRAVACSSPSPGSEVV